MTSLASKSGRSLPLSRARSNDRGDQWGAAFVHDVEPVGVLGVVEDFHEAAVLQLQPEEPFEE